MEAIFMNSENSKTSEPHRFKLDLTDKLNLKNPNKNMALANLSIYYTWKNIKSEYNNNKFKISAPTWNDTFDLPNGSFYIADIQDYFEFIIRKQKTLTENAPVQIYPNKIKNRIVFKMKTEYKLELLTPETMKMLGSTNKDIDKIKMEKLYQNQNLLKFFQCIVIQLKIITSTHQKFTNRKTAKTASKRVVQKTAEATEELIVNKETEKITSIGQPKEKEKINKAEEIYIPP